MESEIIAILFKHKLISLEKLKAVALNKGYTITGTDELKTLVDNYPEVRIFTEGGETKCEYQLNIEVCARKPLDSTTGMCKLGFDCSKIHICTFFVNGECSKGNKCHFPHDLTTPGNTAFVRKHGLEAVEMKDIFSQTHFKEGLVLTICSYYNSENGCRKGNDCNFLHICRNYIVTKCPKSCEYNHNVFKTNCIRVLKTYDICVDQRPVKIKDEIKQKIQTHKKSAKPQTPASTSSPPPKPTPAPTPPPPSKQLTSLKEAICTYNIREKCRYNESCIRQHHTLPYQWFYMDGLMWKPFTEETQTKLEEEYCNVSIVSYTTEGVTVNFDKMRKDSKVVRLSTPSSVTEPPNHPFTTKWTWYWQDNSVNAKGNWREYTQKVQFKANTM
ncbi:protein mono-ADP-ribosyltransferase PARP12-like [Antedon mediterranea]|uniref:protein mono-ADP-ribosyltransferase PARP12-like n=1 Tax=Antedon mediterranea TaxID=105859 RepID=UPI003AF7248C